MPAIIAMHTCWGLIKVNSDRMMTVNQTTLPVIPSGLIRSKNLTNVLVIVVRYFGGTKLGVGGLVTAYKTAAEEALTNAQLVEEQIRVTLVFEFTYDVTPTIMKLVKDFDLTIINQEFGESCLIKAAVLLSLKKSLLERIRLLNVTGTVFMATEVE